MKVFDIVLALRRKFNKKIKLGDAYFFWDNDVSKIKSIKVN